MLKISIGVSEVARGSATSRGRVTEALIATLTSADDHHDAPQHRSLHDSILSARWRLCPTRNAKGPHRSGGLSRNPGGDLLSQGGTPKYHRRWWA